MELVKSKLVTINFTATLNEIDVERAVSQYIRREYPDLEDLPLQIDFTDHQGTLTGAVIKAKKESEYPDIVQKLKI